MDQSTFYRQRAVKSSRIRARVESAVYRKNDWDYNKILKAFQLSSKLFAFQHNDFFRAAELDRAKLKN